MKTEVYCLKQLIIVAIEAPAAVGGRSGTSSNHRWLAAKLAEEELDANSARVFETKYLKPGSGASPVTYDAEQDSPESLAVQDTPDSPVDQDACGQDTPDFPVVQDSDVCKRLRHVTVQDYPWKFVSPQLLDRNGREILYPIEDDRDLWWARKMECAIDYRGDLAERDMDGLQAYSLEIVKRVQQKMAKEKCRFSLRRMSSTICKAVVLLCPF
jgi:hypothetical protein